VNTDTDAAHAKPAMTTPPTRCEHRGHPFSCADLLSCSCLWARLRAATCRARRAAVYPMNGASSRLAGENLEPWLPQAASTGRSR
jgi:hypothetical protein